MRVREFALEVAFDRFYQYRKDGQRTQAACLPESKDALCPGVAVFTDRILAALVLDDSNARERYRARKST